MAKGDSVSKSKKSNSFKPYDANNSLVRRVTSRVSQYLPHPTNWLRSFLAPSDLNEQSSSAPVEDDGPIPAKRQRIAQTNTDIYVDAQRVVDTNVESNREEEISPIRNVGSVPVPRTDYAVAGPSGLHRKQFVASTPAVVLGSQPAVPKINGDEASDSESASCSSAPIFGRRLGVEKPQYLLHRPLHQPPPSFSKGPTPGSSKQARVEMNTSLNLKEQFSFNSTVFCSPFKGRLCATELSPSILNCSSHDSSFYKGNTTFGGASSSTDSLLRIRALPSETPVIVKPTETAKQSCNLATSTTRILKALEQFSSPVLDARKMVPGRSPGPRRAAPFRELVVPTMPDLLRIKRRDARQLRAARAAARSAAAAASHSSTSPAHAAVTLSAEAATESATPISNPTDAGSVFSRLGSGVASSSKEESFPAKKDVSQKLPGSNFGIPVASSSLKPTPGPFSSLPKFDPGIVKPFTPPSDSLKSSTKQNDPPKIFNFSKPIPVAQEAPPPSPSCWKFSKPLSPDESSKPLISSEIKPSSTPIPPVPEIKMVYTPSQQVLKRKPLPVPETTPISSSVDKKETILSKADSRKMFESKPQTTEQKWECQGCYIQNKVSVDKCVACEKPRNSSKPVQTPAPEKKPPEPSPLLNCTSSGTQFVGFGDKFKMAEDQWECSSCLVRNNNKESKCVSCGQAKESKTEPLKLSDPPPQSAPKTTISSSSTGKWECKDCYVQNKEGDTTCVSCSSKRTGSIPTSQPCSNPLSALFKKPEGMWECDSCLVQNKSDVTSCIACGTTKPGATEKPKSSTPSFGLGTGMAKPSQPTFSFGIKPEATASPVTFGVPSSLSTASTAPTSTAPTFIFGQPSIKTATSSTPVFFGIPPKTEEKNEKPETSTETNIFGQPSKPVAKPEDVVSNSWGSKNESSNFSTPVPMSPDTAENKPPAFGVPANKPDAPSSSTLATGFTFGAVQTTAASTTGIATSLVQSSPIANASPFSTSTAVAPATTASSLFTFGSNPVQQKPEAAVNSFDNKSAIAPSQEAKNIFGSVLNKPQVFGSEPSAAAKVESSIFGKVEDKSKLFSFGSSDKSNVNCIPAKPATGGFTFGQKPEEPKTNTLKPTSEPGKIAFESPSTFPKQTNTLGGFFSNPVNSDKKDGFSFGGNNNNNSFQFKSPALTFGAKPSEPQQPVVNHTNSLAEAAPAAPSWGETPTPANTSQTPAPVFNFTSPQQNNSTPSPFSFSATQAGGNNTTAPVSSGFSFGSTPSGGVTQPAPPSFDPSAKPAFNFSSGQSSSFGTKSTGAGGFAFKPAETTTPAFGFGQAKPNEPITNHTNSLGGATPQFGASSTMFGAQPSGGGMFNSPSGFGANSTQMAAPVFNFSATQQNNASPFSFSATQGTANRAAAPASTGFTFGAAQPPAAAQAPPAFDPNAKPTFNFTAGQPPTFSAGTPGEGMLPHASDSTAKLNRKIRKAIRRTIPK